MDDETSITFNQVSTGYAFLSKKCHCPSSEGAGRPIDRPARRRSTRPSAGWSTTVVCRVRRWLPLKVVATTVCAQWFKEST
mgnify:CR=1 FL=1